MDFLAKSLGLDIEAIAVKLAMQDDTPPTQTQVIEGAKFESPVKEKKKTSPLINPKVIRPEPSQHGSPFSSYSGKQPQVQKEAVTHQPNFASRDFSADKINQAFQNLFGSGFGEGNAQMQTPSFLNNNQNIKAKPLYESTSAVSKKISSVFSPVPCKPQSQTSIFGVRGDHNTPYTPFNKQSNISPGNFMKKPSASLGIF